jgi:5-methyltetrahydrofolate--homocysteine methyltransferase
MPVLRFGEEDWRRVEQDTMAWWEGDLRRPLVWLAVRHPSGGEPPHAYLSNYPLDMPAERVLDLFEPVIAATSYHADAFPTLWVNLGPGIMSGFMGARVHSVTEPSETVWFSAVPSVSVGDLDLTYDPQNLWWKRAREFTAAMVQRWAGQLAVGHTDLGGNMDILAAFCSTEGLLLSLVDGPEQVERMVRRVTELWLRYYDELDALIHPTCRGTTCWTPIWSSGRTYMLQCDFSYMISPAMFERFVLPDLTACCDHLDHGFYHLDGKGEIPHLDALLSIQRLRGIQWVPGEGQLPPEQWLPLLKRIRDGGKLCQVFVSPEGARTIVRNLGGRGFLLVISYDEWEFADPERVEAFLKTLAREDISLSR